MNEGKKEVLEVIFRVFPKQVYTDGTVIPEEVDAFFPKLFYRVSGIQVLAFAEIGGHYEVDTAVSYRTRLAKPQEYESILKTIKRIYDDCEIKVVKRFPSWSWYRRHKDLRGE